MKIIKVVDVRLSFHRHSSESWNPRLQGCAPAWMQMVERRREQTAGVVESRLEHAAGRRPGWTYSELP